MKDKIKHPIISIQMCTYNRAHFIEQAIQSVLAQSFTNWELLILDDCSTDNTRTIVSKYLNDPRIKYVHNSHNLGINKNRNKALSLSHGRYIAVLDSDDYWTDENKLLDQIEFLSKHREYVLVGTNMIIVDENNKKIKKVRYPSSNFALKRLLLLKNLFCHSSVMYRRDEITNLGGYSEELPIWEDYDLWLRIGLKYKFANLKTYTTAYRKHDSQSNSERIQLGRDTQKDIIEKYKKYYKGYAIAKAIDRLRNLRK